MGILILEKMLVLLRQALLQVTAESRIPLGACEIEFDGFGIDWRCFWLVSCCIRLLFLHKKTKSFHTVHKLKTVVIILDLKGQEISKSYGLETWSF